MQSGYKLFLLKYFCQRFVGGLVVKGCACVGEGGDEVSAKQNILSLFANYTTPV